MSGWKNFPDWEFFFLIGNAELYPVPQDWLIPCKYAFCYRKRSSFQRQVLIFYPNLRIRLFLAPYIAESDILKVNYFYQYFNDFHSWGPQENVKNMTEMTLQEHSDLRLSIRINAAKLIVLKDGCIGNCSHNVRCKRSLALVQTLVHF